MSTSMMSSGSAGFTVPGSSGSPSSYTSEPPLNAYIERTLKGVEDFARREPWVFATWMFGLGFVLGWKLKPW